MQSFTGNLRLRSRQTGTSLRVGSHGRLAAILCFMVMAALSFYSASSASSSNELLSSHHLAANVNKVNLADLDRKVTEHQISSSFKPMAYASLLSFPQAQGPLTIATYASNCSTSQTSFNRAAADKTVCAKVTGATPGWHLIWSDSNSNVVQDNLISSSTQTNTFTLSSNSSLGDWRVIVYEPFGGTVQAVTSFTVFDSGNPVADLTVNKGPKSTEPAAGSQVTFALQVQNYGPSSASLVVLTDDVPANTTFVSFTQLTGPAFTCVNPATGATGITTCTIASLNRGDIATFLATYLVNSGAVVGTEISNTASITSATNDNNSSNNSSTAVVNVGSPACVLTCPANITMGNDQDQYGAVVTYQVTDNGNCGTVSSNPPSGSFFPVGTTLVTAGGESGDPCSFTVTINDTQVPAISCPANVTTTESPAGSGSATVNYPPPTVTDNDPQVSSSCDHPSGSSFPVGTTTVTCTATDRAQNSSSCTFTVTVQSAAGCTFTCPQDVTVNNDAGDCGAVVSYPDATSSQDCAAGTVSYSQASGTRFPVGTTVVTATRSTGESCSFRITVVDNQTPTISCPANITTGAAADRCDATVDPGTATATDNCPGVTVAGQRSDNAPLNALYHVGTTTITWTATDTSGNKASCQQTVTVTDTTPPTITCPPNITRANDPGQCSATVDPGNATATDGCGIESVTGTRSDGQPLDAPYPIGTTAITWTATDQSGNQASCTQTVTVNDTENPTIACPANVARANDPGSCSANINPGTATATDNCSATVTGARSDGQPLNASYPVGTTTITWTATDASNNSASCTQTVTVSDTEPPTVSCPADVTRGTDPGSCSATFDSGTATATDNCAGATVSGTRSDGQALNAPYPKGTTTITWIATDSSGNRSTSCTQTVTVNDTEAPAITCPNNVTTVNLTGDCSASANVGVATATDNCDANVVPVPSRSDQKPLTDPFPVGTTTITWTATDSAGNHSSCDQTVTVADNEKPKITCPADVTTNTEPGTCSAHVNHGTATATDNCGAATVGGSRSDGRGLDDTYPKGTTTITWTATDLSGNQSSCTQTITVVDNEAPVITCPANITTGTDPGTCSATVNPGTATATDNCDVPTVTGARSDGQALNAPYPRGTTTITWTATDGSGNSSSCTQTVTVNDTEKPTITTNGQTPVLWPANHQYHTFNVTDFVTGVSDNCDTLSVSNVVIMLVTSDEVENGPGSGNTFNDIVIASDCKSVQLRAERENSADGRVYTITFRVTDSSGNVGTKTSQVQVPKNLGVPVVDSGPHYTVTGTCP